MKVSNVRIYGLEESIVASGYPMFEKPLGEDIFEQLLFDFEMYETIHQENHHLKRAMNLGKTPPLSGHNNYQNGIIVQFDVDFTIKCWTEAERYHFLDFVSSMSTMHKLTKFDLDEAYISHVDKRMIEVMKELQQEYSNNPTTENYLNLIYSNPVGMKLTARMTTNYRQLATIYTQRKGHKLPEWREFCEWIISLPYFKQLTGLED